MGALCPRVRVKVYASKKRKENGRDEKSDNCNTNADFDAGFHGVFDGRNRQFSSKYSHRQH